MNKRYTPYFEQNLNGIEKFLQSSDKVLITKSPFSGIKIRRILTDLFSVNDIRPFNFALPSNAEGLIFTLEKMLSNNRNIKIFVSFEFNSSDLANPKVKEILNQVKQQNKFKVLILI